MSGLCFSSPVHRTKERGTLTSNGNDSYRYCQNANGGDGYDQTC